MITDDMKLNSTRDVRQWASDIAGGYEGDYEKNISAMATAIGEAMPRWGCTKSEIDWDAVEKRFLEILESAARDQPSPQGT